MKCGKRLSILAWVMWSACQLALAQVAVGADQVDTLADLLLNQRVALVVNQTSVLANGTHLVDTLLSHGTNVVKLFAPEHGFRGNEDAGAVVGHSVDKKTGLPIISLYGSQKKPLPDQLTDVDVVVFDIQDVGARFYTYISTMHYVMEACAECGKLMVVADRPNPCDYVDGPIRDADKRSFVGMDPLPLLHGCTVGELARMMNGEHWLKDGEECRLEVVRVKGWKHGDAYSLKVKPSPNLPNDQAIALYPSLCPFEGTSVSVGRGTLYPFQVLGSPFLSGMPFCFTPRSLQGFDTNPMHKGLSCQGYDLRGVKAPAGFSLKYVIELYQKYKQTGCQEKFFSRAKWFDLIMGTSTTRKQIEAGLSEDEIRASWRHDLEQYGAIREKYLLYE